MGQIEEEQKEIRSQHDDSVDALIDEDEVPEESPTHLAILSGTTKSNTQPMSEEALMNVLSKPKAPVFFVKCLDKLDMGSDEYRNMVYKATIIKMNLKASLMKVRQVPLTEKQLGKILTDQWAVEGFLEHHLCRDRLR